MDFASEYVFLNSADTEDQEEIDAPALTITPAENSNPQQHRVQQGRYTPFMPHFVKTKVKKVNTNLVAIKLGSLTSAGQMMTGDPIFCDECGAAFNATSRVIDNKMWNCEFCGASRDVSSLDPEEIPKSETLDYLLEPAKEVAESDKEELIIFCIDVSGSMCVTTEVSGNFKLKGDRTNLMSSLNSDNSPKWMPGQRRDVTYVSRLQCVQAAIETQLEKLAIEHPKTKVGIVCFNNEVRLLGDGSQEVVVVSGDKLEDYDTLLEIGKKFAVQKPIRESKETLIKKLFELEETGSTALGPAIVVSIGMALNSQTPGTKLVIATDGLSNTGIGALETKNNDELQNARIFYEQLGAFAKLKGINVNIISIRGEEVNLSILGALADQTDGTVDIVDPLRIREQFGSILQSKLIATEVEVKLFLHKGLKFVHDEEIEAEVAVEQPQKNEEMKQEKDVQNTNKEKEKKNELLVTKFVGNAYEDTELTFEFDVRSKEIIEDILKQMSQQESSQGSNNNNNNNNNSNNSNENNDNKAIQMKDISLPFQVQIRYRKLNGMKYIRIITKTKKITTDRRAAEQTVDFELIGAYGYQKSAKLAERNNYGGAILNNYRYANLLSRNANDEKRQRSFDSYSSASNQFNEQLTREILSSGPYRSDLTSNMIYNYKSTKRAKQYLSPNAEPNRLTQPSSSSPSPSPPTSLVNTPPPVPIVLTPYNSNNTSSYSSGSLLSVPPSFSSNSQSIVNVFHGSSTTSTDSNNSNKSDGMFRDKEQESE